MGGMKQAIILAIAAVAILGAASPAQRRNPPVIVDQIRADCPLTVSFGSYAMGIDSQAFSSILRTLQYDRAVTRIEQRNWGREGERTLCATIRKPAEARRVFKRVKALFPRTPRGPLTVETRSGLNFTANRPMR